MDASIDAQARCDFLTKLLLATLNYLPNKSITLARAQLQTITPKVQLIVTEEGHGDIKIQRLDPLPTTTHVTPRLIDPEGDIS